MDWDFSILQKEFRWKSQMPIEQRSIPAPPASFESIQKLTSYFACATMQRLVRAFVHKSFYVSFQKCHLFLNGLFFSLELFSKFSLETQST
jgi:hypothetical protein